MYSVYFGATDPSLSLEEGDDGPWITTLLKYSHTQHNSTAGAQSTEKIQDSLVFPRLQLHDHERGRRLSKKKLDGTIFAISFHGLAEKSTQAQWSYDVSAHSPVG